MANSKINKVIYGGQTLIDLTADTVTVDKLLLLMIRVVKLLQVLASLTLTQAMQQRHLMKS